MIVAWLVLWLKAFGGICLVLLGFTLGIGLIKWASDLLGEVGAILAVAALVAAVFATTYLFTST